MGSNKCSLNQQTTFRKCAYDACEMYIWADIFCSLGCLFWLVSVRIWALLKFQGCSWLWRHTRHVCTVLLIALWRSEKIETWDGGLWLRAVLEETARVHEPFICFIFAHFCTSASFLSLLDSENGKNRCPSFHSKVRRHWGPCVRGWVSWCFVWTCQPRCSCINFQQDFWGSQFPTAGGLKNLGTPHFIWGF